MAKYNPEVYGIIIGVRESIPELEDIVGAMNQDISFSEDPLH